MLRHPTLILALVLTSGLCPLCEPPSSAESRAIPLTGGTPINRTILGQAVYCQVSEQRALDMQLVQNASMRGVAGGLWAESYNWKKLTGEYLGPQTTLVMLREARDKNAELVITANCRGIGTGTGSSFVYTDKTIGTVAGLAADWVRYTNRIVQNYRHGDPVSGRDRDIVDSITWTTDKLLRPEEKPARKVTYWEIGNEPNVSYGIVRAITVEDYLARYKAMVQAMVAEDPQIKVGPCIINASGTDGNAWLNAVLNDQTCRVDFIAYHPWGPLHWYTENYAGGVLDAYWLQLALTYLKGAQVDRKREIVNALTAAGRDPNTPLLATECNPSGWMGTYYYDLSKCVAHGLGIAETMFTFAELGMKAAMYWDHPNIGSTTWEMPGFKVYEQLQDYMGDTLLDSYVNGAFRLYTTRDSATGRVVLWAINMSDTQDATLDLSLTGWDSPCRVRRMTLEAYSENTTLVLTSKESEKVGWTTTDLTGQLDPANFNMTFGHATLTTVIVDPVPQP